ncbi:MAG TPA: DUF2085 domain-containing protein [Thermoanaerobaculia bacterium]
MKADTKIALSVFSAIPLTILGLATLCATAIAHGAPQWLRTPFRMICHGVAERSLQVAGEALPVCARCSGIYAGVLTGFLLFLAWPHVQERTARIAAWVAVTPLAFDGITQALRLRTSGNGLRLATGVVAGLFFGIWILCAIERRGEQAVPSS